MAFTLTNLKKLDGIMNMDENTIMKELPQNLQKLQEADFKDSNNKIFRGKSINEYLNLPLTTVESVKCPILPTDDRLSPLYQKKLLLLIGCGATNYNLDEMIKKYNELLNVPIALLVIFFVFLFFQSLLAYKMFQNWSDVSGIWYFFSYFFTFATFVSQIVFIAKICKAINTFKELKNKKQTKYEDFYSRPNIEADVEDMRPYVTGVNIGFVIANLVCVFFVLIYI